MAARFRAVAQPRGVAGHSSSTAYYWSRAEQARGAFSRFSRRSTRPVVRRPPSVVLRCRSRFSRQRRTNNNNIQQQRRRQRHAARRPHLHLHPRRLPPAVFSHLFWSDLLHRLTWWITTIYLAKHVDHYENRSSSWQEATHAQTTESQRLHLLQVMSLLLPFSPFAPKLTTSPRTAKRKCTEGVRPFPTQPGHNLSNNAL